MKILIAIIVIFLLMENAYLRDSLDKNADFVQMMADRLDEIEDELEEMLEYEEDE